MKTPLFEFPFYQYQISEWDIKKKDLLKVINKQKFIRCDLSTPQNLAYNVSTETDRNFNNKSYVRYLEEFLRPELSEFFKFKVPGAEFIPAVRNRFWDGYLRLFSLQTNQIYLGLLLNK